MKDEPIDLFKMVMGGGNDYDRDTLAVIQGGKTLGGKQTTKKVGEGESVDEDDEDDS